MPSLVHRIGLGVVASLGLASAALAQVQQPDLHSALHIRPDQEAALRAYQAGTSPPRAQISQIQADYAHMRTVGTMERLSIAGQIQAMQSSMFNRYADATRQFYGALSGPQQRIFDQITLPPQGGPPGPGR